MKLVADYNWRNGEQVAELMEKVLTDEAINAIERAAEGSIPRAAVSPSVRDNLIQIGALREDSGRLRIGVPVISAEDRERVQAAAKVLAVSLGEHIAASSDPETLRDHPGVSDDDDLARYSHFLTAPVALGWQGHEMLVRLGRIPTRAENTDELGRWYLLRFYELAEEHYTPQPIDSGGSMWGYQWSLSTTCASREQNILEKLAGIRHGISEDEIDLRDEVLAAMVDSIAECVASRGQSAPHFRELVDHLGLVKHGKPAAVVLKADEFDIPRAFIESVYRAMVSWWEENEKNVDSVLSETTASRLGIEHRHLYHEVWLRITAEVGVHLREKGHLLDLSKLPTGAINAVWQLDTNLQGEIISPSLTEVR